MDLASNVDRRILSFLEENPQKIMRYIQNFQEKDSQLWKENHHKQLSFQENIDTTRQDLQKNVEQLSQAIVTLNRRIDENDYRIGTFQRDLDGVQVIDSSPEPRE